MCVSVWYVCEHVGGVRMISYLMWHAVCIYSTCVFVLMRCTYMLQFPACMQCFNAYHVSIHVFEFTWVTCVMWYMFVHVAHVSFLGDVDCVHVLHVCGVVCIWLCGACV